MTLKAQTESRDRRTAGWWSDVLYEPRRMGLRKALFQVHLWCGLIVGLLATVAGVTGSAVVYRESLDRRLAPELYRVQSGTALPIDDLLARVHRDLPGSTVQSLDIESGNTPWMFRVVSSAGKGETAYVDAVNGQVLGVRGAREGIMNWLDALHTELLGGQVGTWINGGGAVALFLLCVTGLFVWWPGRNNVRRALRINKPRRWRRFNWDLHTAGGFWISLPLAAEALTGGFLCFGFGWLLVLLGGKKNEFEDLIASPKIAAHCKVQEQRFTPILDRVQVLHPHAEDTLLVLPAGGTAAITVFSRTSADLRVGGTAVTSFDACTGELRKDVDSRRSSIALRTVLFLDALHFGLAGGSVTRVAWVLLGLAPGVLFVTGFLMWWRRAVRPVLSTRLRA